MKNHRSIWFIKRQSRHNEIGRIAAILHRRAANASYADKLIAALAAETMEDQEAEEIIDLLLGEFLSELDRDDEPSAYGREVDDLMGWVALQHMKD